MDTIESWLRVALCPGVGAKTGARLLYTFGSIEGIVKADALALRACVGEIGSSLHAFMHSADSVRLVNTQLECLQGSRGGTRHLLSLHDPRYPESLRRLPDAPLVLYAEGDVSLLTAPSIAVVGSRNATRQGEENAKAFAHALAQAGLCVVSGMALGIDSAAHRGALEAHGQTIAVFGCGIDISYPRRNKALHEEIASLGLVLSEQPFMAEPRPATFPMRNRIISGLSLACLVIEAAASSGSLITAQLALEQGKDVLALPGSIHLAQSKGCHALIKQGAALVESAQDVLDALPGFVVPRSINPATTSVQMTTDSPLLNRLGFDPVSLDEIANAESDDLASLSAELLGLELANRVERLPDGRYLRVS